MRAILVRQFGGPEVMKLEELPDPVAGPGQLVVKICAAGVNPVDTYIRNGAYAHLPALPYTPGADAAGEVDSVGEGVTEYKKGDRVYLIATAAGHYGAYAAKAVCNVEQVHPLPSCASFGQGAAIGVPYATAYRALFHRAQARPAETVLVHGATGGVGIAAVQLARARGMRIIGTGGTDTGLQAVRDQGADVVVSHRGEGYADEIMKATGGRGVDVILEMAAHINLDRDLPMLARHGRVVVIGNRGRIEINPRDAMARDAAILGMTLFNATPADLREIHAALVAGLADGSLKPIVGREMPLGDAAAAHAAVMEPGALGKIVLVA